MDELARPLLPLTGMRRRARTAFGLLMSAFLAAPAGAVFTVSQMERIDPEPLFDRDYFLTLRTFEPPIEWERLWRSSDSAGWRINAASLDCCRLLLLQDLRFDKPLIGGLAFHYRLEQRDDKDYRELRHRLEFEEAMAGGFSAAVFGEPTYDKGDSDIGLRLAYRHAGFAASAARTFVDFEFNRRSGTTQRYSRKPYTDEVFLSWTSDVGLLEAGAEFDWPLHREMPDSGRSFWYRRTRAWGQWSTPDRSWSARYSYEFERKGDLSAPDASSSALDYSRKVHQLSAARDVKTSSVQEWEFGAQALVRAARDDVPGRAAPGRFYGRWEAQPYLRWRRRLAGIVIADAGPLLSFGEDRRPGDDALIALARAAAGIELVFSPQARLGLNTTWRLDAPGHPWGGGNIRALLLF